MDQHHIDEKKPADAGDVEELKRAIQALRESPKFQLRLALGKLNYLLRTMDGDLALSREVERDVVRHGIFAALTWLSEAEVSLFPEDQRDYWIRRVHTLHFDSVCAQYDTSDWALSRERVNSGGESPALADKAAATPKPAD